MSEPRIITPQQAERWDDDLLYREAPVRDLAHTVATEPDRIRAAVVKALRAIGCYDALGRADAIESGTDR